MRRVVSRAGWGGTHSELGGTVMMMLEGNAKKELRECEVSPSKICVVFYGRAGCD